MKTKTLIILVCVAAALMAAAVMMSNRNSTLRSADPKSQLLFKDLPVNDITRILITSSAGQLELKRGENGWLAPGKYNYPVRFDKITEALLALIKMKAGEQRRPDKTQRVKAQLVSPLSKDDSAAGKATLTQLFTSDDAPVASLLVGAARMRKAGGMGDVPDGKYISTDDGETSFLAAGYLGDFENTDVRQWLKTELLNVNSFSITNITITQYDEKPLVLYADGKGPLTMDKLSRKEKVDENKAQSVRYALSSLRFDDLADPSLDDKAMGFDKPSTFRAVTDKSEVYTLTIGKEAEGTDYRYVRIAAEFTGTIPEELSADDAEKSLDDTRKQMEEARDRVKSVTELVNGWSYLLAPSRFGVMLYSRKDLVAKKDD